MDDFYLFANCNFVPDRYNDWQAAYDDLAAYVWTSEPTTKTYYFGIPMDYAHDFSKTTSMFAFEVYSSREALYSPTGHLSSPAMSSFLSLIPPASTTGLDLHHYRALAGFLDLPARAPPTDSSTSAPAPASAPRSEEAEKNVIMQDVRITCTSPPARDALIAELKLLIGHIEQEARSSAAAAAINNNNTSKSPSTSSTTTNPAALDPSSSTATSSPLTYMAFASLDQELELRLFGRWASRQGFERFIRKDEVVGFWMRGKEWVAGMEQRLYVGNGKGWLHRGEGSGYAGGDWV